MAERDKYYLFVNEINGTFDKTVGQSYVMQAYDHYKKRMEMIILNDNLNAEIRKKKLESIASSEPTVDKMSRWISEIEVKPINVNKSIPHIFIDNNSVNWFYYLDKYSDIWSKNSSKKDFTFEYLKSPEEISGRVAEIRDTNPYQMFWVLCTNK